MARDSSDTWKSVDSEVDMVFEAYLICWYFISAYLVMRFQKKTS